MKILYIAKHGSGYNQDEDAISDALGRLGHEVLRIKEHGKGLNNLRTKSKSFDFLLFHKWYQPDLLATLRLPKVFWYFDLVDYPDPILQRRCRDRIRWMNQVTPLVDLGFCTDGDWVEQDDSGKLIKLTQGADQRFVGRGETKRVDYDVLFTGIHKRAGRERSEFVDFMYINYGNRFRHQASGCHGSWLANLIASTRIVVAPKGPRTDNYWSNRVYLSCGFGGFVLHPYCAGLTKHYVDREEIAYYHSYDHLNHLIEFYLDRPKDREGISEAGLQRTIREHTYLQRCAELVQTVQRRLF